MPLATVDDYMALTGEQLDPAKTKRVLRLLELAEGIVRAHVRRTVPSPTPAGVVVVVVKLAHRQVENPTDVRQEGLGSHQVMYAASGMALDDDMRATLDAAMAGTKPRFTSVQLSGISANLYEEE